MAIKLTLEVHLLSGCIPCLPFYWISVSFLLLPSTILSSPLVLTSIPLTIDYHLARRYSLYCIHLPHPLTVCLYSCLCCTPGHLVFVTLRRGLTYSSLIHVRFPLVWQFLRTLIELFYLPSLTASITVASSSTTWQSHISLCVSSLSIPFLSFTNSYHIHLSVLLLLFHNLLYFSSPKPHYLITHSVNSHYCILWWPFNTIFCFVLSYTYIASVFSYVVFLFVLDSVVSLGYCLFLYFPLLLTLFLHNYRFCSSYL